MEKRNRYQAFIYLPVFFLTFFFTIPFPQCFADSPLIIDPEKQFNFAESYFSNKNYLRSIAEYERYIYFFPDGDKVELAMYRIGMAYFEGGRFKDAIFSFNKILEKYPKTDTYVNAYFMISECRVKREEFGEAILHLQNLLAVTEDIEIMDRANYKIGWIYIELAEWEKARFYFGEISINNRNKYRLEKLMAELALDRSIEQKNPRIAGLLSLLPGAGYAYCERYHDALIAFLLNGGLILAAYESFDQELYALGGVITFVEFGFYAGSIYGSIAGAHKYNRTKTRRLIENLKQNSHINLSSGYKPKSILLSFQYQF